MLTAEARIDTPTPSRYLVQFCKHASGMHRGFAHKAAARRHAMGLQDVQLEADWSEDRGIVRFDPWGRCTLSADDGALLIHVDATDADRLRRIQEIVTRNLERFGWRDQLTVRWAGGEVDPVHPAGVDSHDRAQHWRLLFATAGALGIVAVIAVHLTLAGAVVAIPAWFGWTTAGVIAVPGLIAVVHAAAPVSAIGLGRHALRRRNQTKPPARR